MGLKSTTVSLTCYQYFDHCNFWNADFVCVDELVDAWLETEYKYLEYKSSFTLSICSTSSLTVIIDIIDY